MTSDESVYYKELDKENLEAMQRSINSFVIGSLYSLTLSEKFFA